MPEELLIDFKDVSIFQSENLVLNNVSLRIGKGEFVYIIGKTGSGKTSLLKTMYADLELKQGEAKVAGYDLLKLRNREIPHLRRKLGIVFQDFQLLFDRSVDDNLLFVLKATGWKNKKEMKDRLNTVLEKVGLSTKGYKMPHQLSGGEQQRVAIARALINNPALILADEPTGNLDTKASMDIISIFCQLNREGITIVMVTHEMDIAAQAKRIVRLLDGQIIEDKLTGAKTCDLPEQTRS